MTDLFKLLQPLQYLESYLAKKHRPDGRALEEFRNAFLLPGCVTSANGSAVVKMGTSSVIAGITTSVVCPPTDRPDEGILDLNVKFSNTCTIEFDNFDRTVVADYVRECLKKVFQHARVIDLGALCLVPGKHVWRLELEVVCLNFNGSLPDMSLLAAVAALQQCRLTRYEVDDELDLITPTKEHIQLKLRCYPQIVSFVVLKKYLLTDPTTIEEELSDSIIRIGVEPNTSKSGEKSEDSIYFFEISGSASIDQSIIKQCHSIALDRARFLQSLVVEKASITGEQR